MWGIKHSIDGVMLCSGDHSGHDHGEGCRWERYILAPSATWITLVNDALGDYAPSPRGRSFIDVCDAIRSLKGMRARMIERLYGDLEWHREHPEIAAYIRAKIVELEAL